MKLDATVKISVVNIYDEMQDVIVRTRSYTAREDQPPAKNPAPSHPAYTSIHKITYKHLHKHTYKQYIQAYT